MSKMNYVMAIPLAIAITAAILGIMLLTVFIISKALRNDSILVRTIYWINNYYIPYFGFLLYISYIASLLFLYKL